MESLQPRSPTDQDSDIQDHKCPPAIAVSLYDFQTVEGDCFDIHLQLMAGRIYRLATKLGLQPPALGDLRDRDMPGAQQEPAGILQEYQLPEIVEQEQVKGNVFQAAGDSFYDLDGLR